ncbi:MAG: S8 family serine peptidase, partial [Gemmatimonadales bacterium]
SVGAVDSLGREANFSSHGPTADGRIKPEVSGPGVDVIMAARDSGLAQGAGTSFATPLIAGIAALAQSVRGALPAAQLRRGIQMAASHPFTPNDTSGWGIPDALKLYAFPTGVVLTGPPTGPLATVTPVLTWDAGVSPPGTTPNTYRLHVWIDSTFQHSLLDTTIAVAKFTFPAGVHGGSRLFWLVVATSSLGVAESTAVKGPSIVPAWVTQLTLAAPQGATIRDSLPTFVWQSPQAAGVGPFTYDVAIYPASRTPASAVAFARGISDTTFQPASPLEKNLPYRWRVVAHLGADSEIVTSPGTFLVADQSAPVTTLLFQNFPNPFPNAAVGLSSTCIWFDVANTGDVRLEIFDLRGRMVKRLAPSALVPAQLSPGRYGRPAGDAPGTCDPRFAWDGRDAENNYVRAGVYVYRLTAPGFRDTRRIVFLGPP